MNIASIMEENRAKNNKEMRITNFFLTGIHKRDHLFQLGGDFEELNVYSIEEFRGFKFQLSNLGHDYINKGYYPKEEMWLALEVARDEIRASRILKKIA